MEQSQSFGPILILLVLVVSFLYMHFTNGSGLRPCGAFEQHQITSLANKIHSSAVPAASSQPADATLANALKLPDEIASRQSRIKLAKKCRLCSVNARAASISPDKYR